ncbi:MAG: bile acid:sodium symporter family protein [Pseudomonadota bacterium]|nr:bile acid:sodium symporter family protein [Pseudomonadota bacterium]
MSLFTNAFPLWVLTASGLALIKPELFTWFSGFYITAGLGVIMLGMGLTLRLEDFKNIARFPGWVLLGILLQFGLMPTFGWGLGYVFDLPSFLAAGLILVACCPGGTASNVICFLARANVALSVTMTALSTLAAVVLTPTLTSILVGARVDISAWGLFVNTVQVVLLPVTLGVILNRYASRVTDRVQPIAPAIAVVAIVLIVASIIGSGREMILTSGASLVAAVLSLHVLGFGVAYVLAAALTKNTQATRTISVEVGMQNSGLGAVLAKNNLTDPAAAIPSAISSVFHCLIGSLLAGLWRARETNATEDSAVRSEAPTPAARDLGTG